jgi:pimeloyl-ACP methyl ester carboxylesterase
MTEPMSEQQRQTMNALLRVMGEASRTPVLRRPSDYGMPYEDVFFPALDGTVIEGWFIPGDSDRVLLFNHFKGANRYGFPGHLEPWRSQSAGFEVNLLPLYKALHEAGYNILTYDLRGNGLSAPGPHPIIGSGLVEYRDVIGSLRYLRSRADTRHMGISLYTQCYGAVATFTAIHKHPGEFEGVRSMIALQPLSAQAFIDGAVAAAGISQTAWEAAYEALTSRRTEDIDMPKCARSIRFPTFLVQVRDDVMTKPYDIQAVFDTLPVEDKKLFWIEGTTVRTEAYRYFVRDPAPVLEWFDAHP